MNDGANLNHLADIAGVEPEYWDIWGNHHPIPAAAKKSILAALGLAVADDEAIARSMQQLQDAQWRRWLPPVLVATVGETLTIPLTAGGPHRLAGDLRDRHRERRVQRAGFPPG
ncbi:MAG: hypothetical protein HWD60_06965 [Defluviicoccus sp.]|nr:MAG: hypothetical protein HWD60_06965 [Defluviicoccus sp.]